MYAVMPTSARACSIIATVVEIPHCPVIHESLLFRDKTTSATEVMNHSAISVVRRQHQGQAARTGPRSITRISIPVVAPDGLSSDPNVESRTVIRIFYPSVLGFWDGVRVVLWFKQHVVVRCILHHVSASSIYVSYIRCFDHLLEIVVSHPPTPHPLTSHFRRKPGPTAVFIHTTNVWYYTSNHICGILSRNFGFKEVVWQNFCARTRQSVCHTLLPLALIYNIHISQTPERSNPQRPFWLVPLPFRMLSSWDKYEPTPSRKYQVDIMNILLKPSLSELSRKSSRPVELETATTDSFRKHETKHYNTHWEERLSVLPTPCDRWGLCRDFCIPKTMSIPLPPREKRVPFYVYLFTFTFLCMHFYVYICVHFFVYLSIVGIFIYLRKTEWMCVLRLPFYIIFVVFHGNIKYWRACVMIY